MKFTHPRNHGTLNKKQVDLSYLHKVDSLHLKNVMGKDEMDLTIKHLLRFNNQQYAGSRCLFWFITITY